MTRIAAVILSLATLASACGDDGGGTATSSPRPTQRTTRSADAPQELGQRLIDRLGAMDAAMTVIRALQRGYTISQVVKGITSGRLAVSGVIPNVGPPGGQALGEPRDDGLVLVAQSDPENLERTLGRFMGRNPQLVIGAILKAADLGYTVDQITTRSSSGELRRAPTSSIRCWWSRSVPTTERSSTSPATWW